MFDPGESGLVWPEQRKEAKGTDLEYPFFVVLPDLGHFGHRSLVG